MMNLHMEMEELPNDLLTKSCMLISEPTLNAAWKDECDEEWEQYLKG